MILKTDFGTYDVHAKLTTYQNNGNLAIRLVDNDFMPFAMLTVNTDQPLNDNYAYVDTNNCPWAEEFITKYNLGHPVGIARRSGHCVYPLYRFNLTRLEAMR